MPVGHFIGHLDSFTHMKNILSIKRSQTDIAKDYFTSYENLTR